MTVKWKDVQMPLEIEVKFYLGRDEERRISLIHRIEEMGGRSRGRVFERNIRFEDERCSLIQRKSLLRLRKDRRTRLTFKSAPAGMSDQDRGDFKIFHELEVDVGDFSTMVQILEAVGFHQAQVYEKWRETFQVNGSLICMDTMPYGEFLEIEGPKEAIPVLAAGMGLDWDCRILENYLGIFAGLKEALRLSFNDITFENFKKEYTEGTAREDLSSYIRRFERTHRSFPSPPSTPHKGRGMK